MFWLRNKKIFFKLNVLLSGGLPNVVVYLLLISLFVDLGVLLGPCIVM